MAKVHLKTTALREVNPPAPFKGSHVSLAVERPLSLTISLLIDKRRKLQQGFHRGTSAWCLQLTGEAWKTFPFSFL